MTDHNADQADGWELPDWMAARTRAEFLEKYAEAGGQVADGYVTEAEQQREELRRARRQADLDDRLANAPAKGLGDADSLATFMARYVEAGGITADEAYHITEDGEVHEVG